VTSWFVVMHTYLYYFPSSLSHCHYAGWSSSRLRLFSRQVDMSENLCHRQ